MSFDTRSLAGCRIGISISQGESSQSDAFVNRSLERFAAAALRHGASVVLGHRWMPGGVMDHCAQWAVQFKWPESIYPHGASSSERKAPTLSPIVNLLAWPDEPPEFLAEEFAALESGVNCDPEAVAERRKGLETTRRQLEQLIRVEVVKPPELVDHPVLDDSNRLYLRGRALTEMRLKLVNVCDARICIGGKLSGWKGRLAGVIEEALFTWKSGKPLYISGALGGASRAMSDVLLGKPLTAEAANAFRTPEDVGAQYDKLHHKAPEGKSSEMEWDCLQEFQSIDLEKLSSQAGLSVTEYTDLMTTQDINRVLAWFIAGCGRVRKR